MEEAIKKWDRIDVLINNGKITNNPKIKGDGEGIFENKQQQQTSYFVSEEYQTSEPLISEIYYCVQAAVTMMLSNEDSNSAIINKSFCHGCIT